MKKNLKTIILAATALVTLGSCSDFLTVEPDDKITQDKFYTSAEMLRANTLSLYAAKTWDDYMHDFQWKTDMLCGDMFYTYSAEGQWYFGTYTSVNAYIFNGWNGIYNVIAFCNSVIHDMPTMVNGVAQEDIDKAIAEARCIRAFCYYTIAELWHDAPIVENNTENITSNNLQLPRNTQKSLYRFALEDLDYAVETLPETDKDAFRCTKTTARAIRAKLKVTMASHTDYGYDRAKLYAEAAEDCKLVMDSREVLNNIPYSTLFDAQTNNGPESILAIQCGPLGYGYGNPRNISWGRNSVIADGAWGGGKGPTISLQKQYTAEDTRRQWVFMTQGDFYPNLCSDKGGYTYQLIARDDSGTEYESRNEMNAHLKKYVIGKSADCDGMVGNQQDAGNNIYLMRLADVYFLYCEAKMGVNNSTSDPAALSPVNSARYRAGLDPLSEITYEQLLVERRKEFAMEGTNWFDILRYRYRAGDDKALEFLNSGWGTGINRNAEYRPKPGMQQSQENDPNQYIVAQTAAEGATYQPIILDKSAFVIPLPAMATTSSPQLLKDPVDYYKD